MTGAWLLYAMSLGVVAPEDDEVVLDDEELPEDELPSDELGDDEVDEGPDPTSDDVDGNPDSTTAATAPRPPPAPTTGRIPTEGSAKPPPSAAALDRDNPLSRPDGERRDRAGRPGSPQRFALELKMGPFLPDVDRKYTGSGLGPYATVFGETNEIGAAIDQPKAFPMPVLAFDWQFFYLAGPLGIGVQAGFFRDKADALVTTPADDGNLRSSADETTFAMLPLSLLLSYRFELLADRWRIPLVPYAKTGLGYSLYWTKSGSGNLARNSRGEAGRGGVPGWQTNLGAMLRLDFIEPGTAKKLDNTTGINHTYLFGEYQLSRIDNFGAGQAISLGDSTWFAGLAIEF